MNSLLVPAATLTGREQAANHADVARHVVGEAVWAPSVHNTQPWWFTANSEAAQPFRGPRPAACGRRPGRAGNADQLRRSAVHRPARAACGRATSPRRGSCPTRPSRCSSPGWAGWIASLPASTSAAWPPRCGPGGRIAARSTPCRSPRNCSPFSRSAPAGRARCWASSPTRAAARRLPRSSRQPSAPCRPTVPTSASSPRGHPRRAASAPTACRPPPTRSAPSGPSPLPPGLRPRPRLGLPLLSTIPGRSPGVLCLLATRSDQPADWVSAGQALQHILLTCAAWGVAVALHSQPFEAGGRDLISPQPGRCPQLLLRLGTTVQVAASVRRPLGSVLVS